MYSEMRPGVFWIHPPDGGEVYVVRTSDGLVLVDSGFPQHRELVLDGMRQAGLRPQEIRLAFCSHLHCDHVGAMGWWRERYGFPVVAHERAAGLIERGDLLATGSEFPLCDLHLAFIPCPIDHRVRGGEKFTVGDRQFEVIHAPGHAVGAIHVLSGDLLFVGDNLNAQGGIGWMDVHWGSNPEDYVETLDRLRAHCGRLALPGHGEPFVLDGERIECGRRIAAFYIPPSHGLGVPRVPSQYGPGGAGAAGGQ
jgi:glyoxylase-like metal-dependent hydrolase (beta-lactamase superfamily II)